MTNTAVRKPDFMRPTWWEIAESLCMARLGITTHMPSTEDVNLAKAIVGSRRSSWPKEHFQGRQ